MSSSTTGSPDILEIDDQTIGALFVSLVFIGVSAIVVNFAATRTTIFDDSKISSTIYQILLALGFLFILAIAANYKALDFLQDHARAILIWSYLISFGLIVGGLGILGIVIILSGSSIGFIFIIIAAGLFFLFRWIWPRLKERLERAAEWLTISATIVLAEPGMIVLSFIQSLVVGIAVITEAIMLFAWINYADSSGVSEDTSNFVVYSILFLYLWLALSIIYYFDGANTYVSYARIHGTDPKIAQGLHASSNKIISIIFYALISAIVTTIVYLLFFASRQQREGARMSSGRGGSTQAAMFAFFLAIIASIVQWLYHLVSFFTLPSIIIRQKNTKEAMSESYGLFRKTFWDLIISDMGYSIGSRIMYIVSGLILAVCGFAYGYFVASSVADTETALYWGIVVGLIALVLGLLVTKFFLRPLYTALVTTIYVYATEGPQALKIVPPKLSNYIDSSKNSPRAVRR